MRIPLTILLLALTAVANAGELDDARTAIAAKLPGVQHSDIVPSPVAGLYEVSVGPQIAYATADGRFLLSGELIDLDSHVNLTEHRRSEARLAVLDGIDESTMVIFSPPAAQVRHTLTVFTDIDCAYCRRLHSEMKELNARGIRVRYLFYPRTGPGTESWRKAVSVWCAPDRQTALTRAKLGEPVEDRTCANPPVLKHYQLGQLMGIQGTPALVAEDGELLAGYLPADMLATRLAEIAKR